MTRVGIVGTGAIARHHALQWQKLNVTLAGYYDVTTSAAEQFRNDFGGTVYGSLAELLSNVDIVDICTPAFAHRECVVAAAQAGLPIVCEKPLARHLADGETMIEACERANVPLFIAHVVRFFPQFAEAKAVIERGLIGKPGVARTVRGSNFPRKFGTAGSDVYADFALSGGVILDVSIHDIDFLRWCCGEVERVFARGLAFSNIPARDHALITLRFTNGAVGHVEGTWAHPPGPFRTRLEIAGDKGLIEWDSRHPGPYLASIIDDSGQVNTTTASPLASLDDPYCLELAHFLDHVRNGTPLRVTPYDAYMALKVALASIESIRTGQPITIANFSEPEL